jgi:hypothetical protein
MAEKGPDQQELDVLMQTATDALRATCLRLLRKGEVYPHILVMAAARVTGELSATAALAGGQDIDDLLGEVGGVVQQAGQEHGELLQAGYCRWLGVSELNRIF